MQPDEKELLRLVAERGEGWQEAFRTLYNLHEKQLSLYVLRRISSSEDAEDILQEVWKAVYERADDFRTGLESSSLYILLQGIALNKITDFFRYKAIRRNTVAYEDAFQRKDEHGEDTVHPSIEELTLGDSDGMATENMVSERELKTCIAEAVSRLDATDRLIYRMKQSGRSLQEIASTLGFSVATIKSHSAYITKMIQRGIKEKGLA